MAIDRTVPSQAPYAFRTKVIEMVSESDPRRTYNVTLPDCDCPDWRYRKAGTKDLCKHLDAAISSGLGGWIDPAATDAAA